MAVMTDQELRDLVASLAIAQEKNSIAQEKNVIVQEKNAIAQEKNAIAQEKNAIAQEKTDEQMKKTDKKLIKMGVLVGNMGKNNGAVAEDFFYSSLSKQKKLGSINYDEIGRSWKKDLKKIRGEYDIVLINGKEVAIVEVKYKVHPSDIEKLNKKLKTFPQLFRDYKNYKIRGALASMSMPSEIEEEILGHGYFALKQQGDHIEVKSPIIN